jgi:extracellular matrix protein 14
MQLKLLPYLVHILLVSVVVSVSVLAQAPPNHRSHHVIAETSASPRLFPFLTWLRDGAIELIFGRPPAKVETATATKFRENLMARYADEVVLRFNVTTLDEEQALSEAAGRMFLDVWAFTKDFVDIQLHRDDVASLLRLVPKSLSKSYSSLIPDLAAAVYATYPSSYLRNEAAGKRRRGTADLGLSRIDGDNIFFRDYQPLPVRPPLSSALHIA